ncbi:glycosyltransferase family A protein [Beijerinckia sp. L45]|uniref:glycosyltransferase family 2 protein n=1 Tax=Beijerinckia sp. L45 TaxID=1641855 RepID=UPI00131B8D00|nr:glycosyltransferase family A protein [Beijerinckia sp. L45]
MKLSVVVAAFNMTRELPRTILSLSQKMQRHVDAEDYEVIIVDNGSDRPADLSACIDLGMNLRVIEIPRQARSHSPVQALNYAIREARGELVGVMIDGARMASPGLLAGALRADKLDNRAVIATLGFHLGPKVQMASIHEGYNQIEEDRLLDGIGWTEDGYRLFDISVFAGSSQSGWFRPIAESNALFMRRSLWDELGGFDERFVTPGGGLANLDTFARAVQLPRSLVVTLLGEGTFHQVHGGVATNAIKSINHLFFQEYEQLRGTPYAGPSYQSLYLGNVPTPVLASVATSAQSARAYA